MDAYVDVDWAADIVNRKTTTGLVIKVFGNSVFWKAQKQKRVSKASTHAEYCAFAKCVEEVLPIIYEDDTVAIALSKIGNLVKIHNIWI